jgi:hypothetical protein
VPELANQLVWQSEVWLCQYVLNLYRSSHSEETSVLLEFFIKISVFDIILTCFYGDNSVDQLGAGYLYQRCHEFIDDNHTSPSGGC